MCSEPVQLIIGLDVLARNKLEPLHAILEQTYEPDGREQISAGAWGRGRVAPVT
jgi:hypothetical protein